MLTHATSFVRLDHSTAQLYLAVQERKKLNLINNWKIPIGFCNYSLWPTTGSKVVSGWFQVGFKVLSEWFQVGFGLVPGLSQSDVRWLQAGFMLVFRWFQVGFTLVSGRFQVSFRMVSGWFGVLSAWLQVGFSLVSSGFRLNSEVLSTLKRGLLSTLTDVKNSSHIYPTKTHPHYPYPANDNTSKMNKMIQYFMIFEKNKKLVLGKKTSRNLHLEISDFMFKQCVSNYGQNSHLINY